MFIWYIKFSYVYYFYFYICFSETSLMSLLSFLNTPIGLRDLPYTQSHLIFKLIWYVTLKVLT